MKINNKYRYYEVEKKPRLSDYGDKDDFIKAYIAHQISKDFGLGFWRGNDLLGEKLIKTYKKRSPRQEIKIGNTVYIERWDSNGIDDEVKIISTKASTSRVLVRCDKGWFTFSKWNCQKDNIEFHWICEGREWEKMYKKWVDGNKYFYNGNR